MTGIKEGVLDAWDNVLSPLFSEFATDITIEEVDKLGTAKDDLYDEPETTKGYKLPVTVKGRAKIERARVVLPEGETKDIDGRVVFKTEDLEAAGIELDFGTRIGLQEKKYIVIHVETSSEVGDKFLLTKALLEKA